MSYSVPPAPLALVVDLGEHRARRDPDAVELWTEVLAAAELHDVLRAHGRRVRFAPGPGGVAVELCDLEGNLLRRLDAAAVVDPRALREQALRPTG